MSLTDVSEASPVLTVDGATIAFAAGAPLVSGDSYTAVLVVEDAAGYDSAPTTSQITVA